MYNKDIRGEILLNIEKDIKEFTRYCSVDKSARILCSNIVYWKPLFDKYNLPITRTYNTPLGWISAFEKERKLRFYTDRLMQILETPKLEDFQSIDIFYDDAPIGLLIYSYDAPFLEIFDNIPEIDQDQLALIVNTYILDKLREKGLEEHTFSRITYFKLSDRYEIEIVGTPAVKQITVSVNRDTVKQILYKILSYGVIPLDDLNNERVNI